jgi:NAD(P)-dependent dehydrogenase (short-subunit alcohol dehydrogenase family)
MDLDDRVAIVTGAAVGTGRAIAERLAAAATSRRAPRTR